MTIAVGKKFDEAGRLEISKEIRDSMGVDSNTLMMVVFKNDQLIIKKIPRANQAGGKNKK